MRIVDVNLVLRTSRTPDAGITRHSDILANDKELKITGRILLNVWRVMRSEISTLTSFTFENVCYEVLKERLPYFSYSTLTQWWNTSSKCSRSSVSLPLLTTLSPRIYSGDHHTSNRHYYTKSFPI